MTGWREVELGDHVDILAGFPFKSAQFVDDPRQGIRLLRGDNVGQGALRWDGAKHWPVPEDEDFNRYHLVERDVILAMDRPWIEAGLKYAYVRPSDLPCLLVQRVSRMRGLATLDTNYLRYLIGSQAFTGHVLSITTGVNVPHISGRDIKRFRFNLPPLETQCRIASILGAYDDLIEVNRRRVAVLEEMARGLFEEWFVRFRFPGHENVPIVDNAEGPLPEGWRMVTMTDVAETNRASLRPKSPPERIGYIDIASVSPGQIDAITWMDFADAPGRARRVVMDGSILWSNVRPNRRSHALVLSPAQDTIASTGFTVLDARAVPFAYLYQWVTTESFVGYLVGNATGSAYPAVTASTFERAPVLLPDGDIVDRFGALAEPIVRQTASLRQAQKRLAASRDLLLPRLISGQLSVGAAQRELQEAA